MRCMSRPRFLLASLSVVSAAVLLDACSSGGGGGGETDGGVTDVTDAGSDVGPDASEDGGVDSSTDAGVDSDADAGIDSGADAGLDSGTDAGVDSGSDAGIDSGIEGGTDGGSTRFYDGQVVDFAVDATNLYLLLPPSSIARCPIAGCDAAGPITIRANSLASEIESGPGVVYFGYRNLQRGYMGQVNADGAGFVENLVFFVGGPYTITFKTLRTDGNYLYGSMKQVGLGQTKLLPVSMAVAGGAGLQHHLQGGPIYDVRGNLEIEYFPGDNLLPEKFTSYDLGGGQLGVYPIPATKPSAVAIHPAVAVMLDTTGMPYVCTRLGCVGWTAVPLVSNAIAMSSTHLYFGTDAGVYRCAVADLLLGCVPELVGSTSAGVAQLVLGDSAVWARTTAPAIEKIDLP